MAEEKNEAVAEETPKKAPAKKAAAKPAALSTTQKLLPTSTPPTPWRRVSGPFRKLTAR